MMNMFLGECTFKKGVSNYLKEHRYNNAEQDDLWKAMSDQAHKDRVLQEDITIKEIMDTWTVQSGYPIINVRRNYADGSAVITQVIQ
jgi:aminopeptidase N